jgi:hypothetical protein
MSIQLLEALAQVINLQEGIAEINEDQTLEAFLPRQVAKILQVPESVTFSTTSLPRCTFVSYNSDLFQRCETLLGEEGSVVSLAVEYQGYLKKSGFEKLVKNTLIPQNGLLRVGEATPAWTPYCRFNVAYTAEAEEKRLGLVSFWLNGLTGVAGVDVGDALLWSSDRVDLPEDVEWDNSSLVWNIAQQVAQEAIETEIKPWAKSLQRKLNRDERRLREYYQTIIDEIRSKCQKKNLEGEALAKEMSRIEATELELTRKLLDLKQRYTLNLKAQIHSVMVVWLQTIQIECQLIRKKNKRTIIAVYNPYTRKLEPLRCEKTNLPVTQFILAEEMQIVQLSEINSP